MAKRFITRCGEKSRSKSGRVAGTRSLSWVRTMSYRRLYRRGAARRSVTRQRDGNTRLSRAFLPACLCTRNTLHNTCARARTHCSQLFGSRTIPHIRLVAPLSAGKIVVSWMLATIKDPYVCTHVVRDSIAVRIAYTCELYVYAYVHTRARASATWCFYKSSSYIFRCK